MVAPIWIFEIIDSGYILEPYEHTDEEVWRQVPLWTLYEVSNKGGIRKKAYTDRRGRYRESILVKMDNAIVYLYDGPNRIWNAAPVASLVLLSFIGPPPKGKYLARHLDDNRLDNRVEKLAWGDNKDNSDDQIKNGRTLKGIPKSEEWKACIRKIAKERNYIERCLPKSQTLETRLKRANSHKGWFARKRLIDPDFRKPKEKA